MFACLFVSAVWHFSVFVNVGHRNLNNEYISMVSGLCVLSHITKALKELTENLSCTLLALIVKKFRKYQRERYTKNIRDLLKREL